METSCPTCDKKLGNTPCGGCRGILSILKEVESVPETSLAQSIKQEILKLHKFQVSLCTEVKKKASIMISEINWQTEKTLQRIEFDCLAKAEELKSVLEFLKSSSAQLFNKSIYPLLRFEKDIQPVKFNLIKLNHYRVSFGFPFLKFLETCNLLSSRVKPLFSGILGNEIDKDELAFNRKLTADSARQLSVALPYFNQIASLTLTSNMLATKEANFLFSSFFHLKNLSKLKISNEITEGVSLLAGVFPKLSGLKTLYLNCGEFSSKALSDLTLAFSYTPEIESLSILGTNLSNNSMKKLTLGLKKLLKLNYLDLSGNKIDQQAAESLGSVLSLFRNLGTLKLGSNALCKDGAAHLTQSLAYLTQLKELNLNSNYLEDKGVSEVCLSLTFLLHLKVLELQDNTLTEASTTKILESVNENIEVLNLSWNSIGSQSIYQFLSHFRNLRKFVCYGATPETSLKTRKFNCSLYI